MTYTKPEVTKLNDALNAIQGTSKPETDAFDVISQRPLAASVNAYEADE